MSAYYMPKNETIFLDWTKRIVDYVAEHGAEIGLSEAEIAPLMDIFPQYSTAFHEYEDARAAAKGRRAMREDKRKETEKVLRQVINRVQAYAGTTDGHRQGMQIPVRGTNGGAVNIVTEHNAPQAIVDISQRLKHVLRIENKSSTGTGKAKPKGVRHVEIWRKMGGDPNDFTGFEFCKTASRSPVVIDYTDGEGNQSVHYRLRWVDGKGKYSPWSNVQSATIAA